MCFQCGSTTSLLNHHFNKQNFDQIIVCRLKKIQMPLFFILKFFVLQIPNNNPLSKSVTRLKKETAKSPRQKTRS